VYGWNSGKELSSHLVNFHINNTSFRQWRTKGLYFPIKVFSRDLNVTLFCLLYNLFGLHNRKILQDKLAKGISCPERMGIFLITHVEHCNAHLLLQSFRMRRTMTHMVNHFTTPSHSCYVNQTQGTLQLCSVP